MKGIKYGGGKTIKYLASTLPPQTKLTAKARIDGTAATVDFFIEKVKEEQLQFLKNYVIVVNENHIPASPTDGEIFTVQK